jgi:hypothetical protein
MHLLLFSNIMPSGKAPGEPGKVFGRNPRVRVSLTFPFPVFSSTFIKLTYLSHTRVHPCVLNTVTSPQRPKPQNSLKREKKNNHTNIHKLIMSTPPVSNNAHRSLHDGSSLRLVLDQFDPRCAPRSSILIRQSHA